MPTEERNIYFSEQEVKMALIGLSARKNVKFNFENISEFKLDMKDTISIHLKVYNAETSKVDNITYGYSEVAAALMGYIMKQKIPLPRTGKKVLNYTKKGLCLTINMIA